MKGCVRVSSNGGSGGLARFWREDNNFQLVSCSKSHIDIDMIAKEDQGQKHWRFTRFYREPNARKRNESWDLSRRLAEQSGKGWLYVGDLKRYFGIMKRLGNG